MIDSTALKHNLLERLQAFAIHLGLSLLILCGLLYLLIFVWYPPPFFAADGGWQGLRIILGVDLILGPMLTLMVYNPAKGWARLKLDLYIIAAVQIVALLAGSWIVYDQRTRMVVFANNRFVSLNRVQMTDAGVTPAELKTLSTQHPAMAFVELPDDPSARQELIYNNLKGDLLFKRGDLYRPLNAANRQLIVAEGYDLDLVARALPQHADKIKRFLQKWDKNSAELSALPLYCRYAELSLVLERSSGEILDTIDINHSELIGSLAARRKSVKDSVKEPVK